MTPKEVAENLIIQAEQLDDLASRYDYYNMSTNAELYRKKAEEARNLVDKIYNNHENIIQELEQISQLINRCNHNGYAWDACQNLRILIEKFLLENQEPYLTHYHNCGGVSR